MVAFIVILSLLAVGIIIYFLLGYAIVRIIVMPKKRTNQMLLEYETKEKKFQASWLDIPCERVFITSDKGNKLHGRLFINENKSDKFIVLCHGYNNSSLGEMKYLEMFLNRNFNVFIPDHRFSGESEGKFLSMGYFERLDVIKWLDYLENRFNVHKFGIFGESMGGATATMVAARDKRINFLISYCGFANLRLLAKYQYGRKLPKFTKYFMPSAIIMAYLCYGIKLLDINPLKDMSKIKIPTLIMHSHGDRLVDIANAEALVAANPNAKHFYFQDSGHARSIVMYRDVYEKQVNEFLEENNC